MADPFEEDPSIEGSDLRQLIQELRAGILARDEFLAIAAHELRNPMSGIVLSVQTLRLQVERGTGNVPLAGLQDKLRNLERRIHQYTRRATMLLDVTRLTTGKSQFELEDLNLSELVEGLIADHVEDFERARCTLTVNLQPNVDGHWDRLGLEQVFVNLLSNAQKYGAGTPVHVVLRATENEATLEVRDEGIGITDEDQRRIFHKFERAVKRQQHGGFGIGLWVSRQIVEALGGTLTVRSSPGQGSTFVVALPRHPPQRGLS